MDNASPNKPAVSRTAFWDVDFDQIDFQEKDVYVMEKVANYGTWSDFLNVVRFYGTTRFKERIVFAAYLKNPVDLMQVTWEEVKVNLRDHLKVYMSSIL